VRFFFQFLVIASALFPIGPLDIAPVHGAEDANPEMTAIILRRLAVGDDVPEEKSAHVTLIPILRGILKDPTHTDPAIPSDKRLPIATGAIQWLSEIAPGELLPFMELARHPDENIRKAIVLGLADR
jgi:hypothetical protein